jgi:spermidine synthase
MVLTSFKEFYNQMKQICSARDPYPAPSRLYCDDKFIEWLPNGTPDPEDPAQKIEDSRKF